jgi:hypothetical protein
MTQLLPVAIRGVFLEKVWEPIINFCSFFNAISHKVIDVMELKKLQDDLIHTLTRLEMHLPPIFFDMSMHLIVRLVHQIKLLGPIFLHHMFPFERLMSVLRKYVRNRYRPEGCMVEGWSTEEALKFCIRYLGHTGLGVPVSRHEGRLQGKGIIGEKRVRAREYNVVRQAHFIVPQQAHIVSPYVKKHKEELVVANSSRSQAWLDKQHREKFAKRLQQHLLEVTSDDLDLDALAMGPNDSMVMYQRYDINAYTFYTRKQDKKSANQNSSVRMMLVMNKIRKWTHTMES